MKFAIEVKAYKLQDLNIPGVTVLERMETEDGTTAFIVGSEQNLVSADIDWSHLPGYIEIEPID